MAILPDRTELTTPADGDLYVTTDVSDTTDAGTGTDKKITWSNIKAGIKTYFDTLYATVAQANATHTGEVTGATALTIDKTAITGKTAVTAVGTDYVLISDTSDTGNLKKALASDLIGAGGAVEGTAVLSTGETGAVKYLREDGDGTCSWQIPAGSGDVSKVGTPANNQVGVWTGDGTIEGDVALTFDTATDILSVTTSGIVETGTIELGHASDTTLSRVSAGVVAVEGVTVPTISSTSTLTNKRITKRVVTTTDDATAVIDVDITDVYELSAMANATTISTTGTPTDGQTLIIRLKDNATPRALTWDAVFVAIGVTLPTTTVTSKWHYIGVQYNSGAAKWHAIAVASQA